MGFSLKSLLKPALGIAGTALGGPLGGLAGSAIGGLFDKKKKTLPPGVQGIVPGSVGAGMQTALDKTAGQSFGNTGFEGLSGFDPGKSFEKYTAGAEEGLKNTFSRGLEDLTGSAVGRNRLNTGYFDMDVGEFGRNLASDYRSETSRAALQTAGMEGDKYRSLAGIEEGRTDRGLDFLSGSADREQANKNANAERKANRRNSIIGGISSIGGAALGAWLGKR